MSEQQGRDQRLDASQMDSTAEHENDNMPHESDDEPMVYVTPRDYATLAREERERRIAAGADPASIILQSEVRNYVPAREGESPADYTKRYVETFNGMMRRGVVTLNDQTKADVVPDRFHGGGREFDVGPKSGATKGEYREFNRWFAGEPWAGETFEVPERWRKFEVAATDRRMGRDDGQASES